MFDVVLNGDHTVVTDLDIFERVGRGIAHDEYIPFKVQGGKLIYNDEESDILAGKIRVEFIKVPRPHFRYLFHAIRFHRSFLNFNQSLAGLQR